MHQICLLVLCCHMKTQSCKAKGRRLQQLIANDIISAFPSLTEDDVRSTSMGANGEDIQMSPAARHFFPFSIEAKNQERLNIWDALTQARHNAPAGIEPVVVFKKNKFQPHVMLSWQAFLQLTQSLHASEGTIKDDALDSKQRLLQAAEVLRSVAEGM